MVSFRFQDDGQNDRGGEEGEEGAACQEGEAVCQEEVGCCVCLFLRVAVFVCAEIHTHNLENRNESLGMSIWLVLRLCRSVLT